MPTGIASAEEGWEAYVVRCLEVWVNNVLGHRKLVTQADPENSTKSLLTMFQEKLGVERVTTRFSPRESHPSLGEAESMNGRIACSHGGDVAGGTQPQVRRNWGEPCSACVVGKARELAEPEEVQKEFEGCDFKEVVWQLDANLYGRRPAGCAYRDRLAETVTENLKKHGGKLRCHCLQV